MYKHPSTSHAELEVATRLLRARERGLQFLAQSHQCFAREEAELELQHVKTQIAANYGQMRQNQAFRFYSVDTGRTTIDSRCRLQP